MKKTAASRNKQPTMKSFHYTMTKIETNTRGVFTGFIIVVRFSIAVLFSSLICSHATADSYDLYEFEIAGVRLGMLPDEAREAAANFYSINVDEIVIEYYEGNEPFPGVENLIGQPAIMAYQPDNGLHLRIEFAPSTAHKDDGYVIVYGVNLGKAFTSSNERNESQKLALNKAKQDYGSPTTQMLSGDAHWAYSWCSEETENRSCENSSTSYEVNQSQTTMEDPKIVEKWLSDMRGQ